MLWPQATKQFIVTSPRAILNNDSWATNEIDTFGFRYCTIIAILGATDFALTALKVQESDTSGSGMADVTGLVYGAAGATALPVDTDDNKIFVFYIDLKGRKRYLDVVATIGSGATGGFIAILAQLSRAEESPNSLAERGIAGMQRLPA